MSSKQDGNQLLTNYLDEMETSVISEDISMLDTDDVKTKQYKTGSDIDYDVEKENKPNIDWEI